MIQAGTLTIVNPFIDIFNIERIDVNRRPSLMSLLFANLIIYSGHFGSTDKAFKT